MQKEEMQKILEHLRAAKTVIISRHVRPDGDAVGSSLGLAEILRASYPEKKIFIDNEDLFENLAYLGSEGDRPTDADYAGATVVTVDCATRDRISNKRIFMGRELIKIDHHVNVEPYGDLSWVEAGRSSTCELIAEFALAFPDELVVNQKAATLLYAGIVSDTGRFRYRETSPSTLRYAAAMMERGIDIQFLYANMYLEEPRILQFHAEIVRKIQYTESGVAWLHISRAYRRRKKLTMQEASDVNNLMEATRGSLIWLVFVECDDGSIRVRLRSRFTEVRELAERYGGGGHACACGATVYSAEEEAKLIAEAEAISKQFKQTHPDLF